MGDRLSAKQVGALIRLDTKDDLVFLAEATLIEIHCMAPRSTLVKIWPANLDGTKLTYLTTSEADLPVEGAYKLQAHLAGPGWSLNGEVATMSVHRSLI